jgi:hypothetical protein
MGCSSWSLREDSLGLKQWRPWTTKSAIASEKACARDLHFQSSRP